MQSLRRVAFAEKTIFGMEVDMKLPVSDDGQPKREDTVYRRLIYPTNLPQSYPGDLHG
jgi:hypothetical protein